jgi:hypothetical protein
MITTTKYPGNFLGKEVTDGWLNSFSGGRLGGSLVQLCDETKPDNPPRPVGLDCGLFIKEKWTFSKHI